jgi:aminoglycoside phosphotransferase (APT) family kinase protein
VTDDRPAISIELVRKLIANQFPQWADLPVAQIIPGGWDHRNFRLGETMVVRLPSAEPYAAQVQKEHKFLPGFARHLPLPIPEVIALGQASGDFPWPFGIYGWLEGDIATGEKDNFDDLSRFAQDLALFLTALNAMDATDGPKAGAHNFFRGGPLAIYDRETRAAIANLSDTIDAPAVTALWQTCLSSPWTGPDVWLHGDIAPGNLLVQNGKLSAVIDFGLMAIGDPACDLAIAWTFFDTRSRQQFFETLPHDRATRQRGRGWALWKALITLEKATRDGTENASQQLDLVHTILQNDPG